MAKIHLGPSRFPSFLRHIGLSRHLTISLLLPSLCLWSPGVFAHPTGAVVVSGDVSFGSTGADQLDIIQSSDRAIIQWDDFSIDAGETTRFLQPRASSIALNRVTGANPTAIYGALQGNGHVFVINPNGILVGASGTIDVHSLALSTLDVQNGEFLLGSDFVFQGSTTSGVTNRGRINAIGGDVFLIGKTVTNSGSIKASGGTVGLAAGEEVLLTAASGPEGERLFVRAEGTGVSGTGILNDGSIEGAAVELKAHGNVYAMAINNKGSVRAIGTETSGGRVFLKGAGGTVSNTGLIRSDSSAPIRAASLLIQAAYAKVDGQLDATNLAGIGGNITIEATETVELGSQSRINASGSAGGGTVLVGGGFQGQDASVANAANTRVDEGSLIIADATESGDAGTVIVWADQETTFRGEISAQAKGGGNGGFVEVSGKQELTFDGVVSTLSVAGLNGTLLLDPANLTVSTAVASATNVNVAAITTALVSNNVVISTSAAGSEDGNITVSNEILYTSANSLTFLAHGNTVFNASVQNSGSGLINIVAGWDGATGFATIPAGGLSTHGPPTAFSLSALLASPTSYGNATLSGGFGAVRIDSTLGLAGTAVAVAVGSRGGSTTVLGHGLTLQSGTATGIDATQLGFRSSSSDPSPGTIDLHLKSGGLSLNGGTTDDYAQIGHGGYFSTTAGSGGTITASGSIQITFTEAGAVSLLAGAGGRGYAQIGHGGARQTPAASGDITIRGGTDAMGQAVAGASRLTLTGSTSESYAQIGHGGSRVSTTTPKGGSATDAHISIDVIGAIDLNGANDQSYAQIGHGGYRTDGMINSGNITLNSAVGSGGATSIITLDGGSGDNAYAQIGHGGADAVGTTPGSRTGNIVIAQANEIRLGNSNTLLEGADSYVQIGHGGDASAGATQGDIRINASGAVGIEGGLSGSSSDAYAQIGHGGHLNTGTPGLSSNVLLVNAASVALSAGGSDRNYAQIGHGGGATTTAQAGSIHVAASGDITVTGGATANRYALIGHGSGQSATSADIATGTRQGGVEIFAGGILSAVNGGGFNNAYLYHQTGSSGGIGGADNYLGGNGFQLIGNGGVIVPDSTLLGLDAMIGGNLANGPVTIGITSQNEITLTSPLLYSNSTNAFTFGTGGHITVLNNIQNSGTGNITLIAGAGLTAVNGSSLFNPTSQTLTITPNGISTFNDLSGFGLNSRTISIGSTTLTGGVSVGSRGGITSLGGSGVTLQAGNSIANSFSQIGYRPTTTAAVSGTISISVRSSGLIMNSGSAAGARTAIGHGGGGASDASLDAPITISFLEPGELDLNAGNGAGAHAQIGHGLSGGTQTKGGAITITNFGVATLEGGSILGTGSFAQIGHGGLGNSGSLSGAINLSGNTSSSSLAIRGGTGTQTYGLIGHGGYDASGSILGTISVTSTGSISLIGGGTYSDASTQIGHGGSNASGTSLSGDILVRSSSGAITLDATATDGTQGQTQIGHGGRHADFSVGISGALTVDASSHVTLRGGSSSGQYTQIGHGGINSNAAMAGHIAVSSNLGHITVTGGSLAASYAMIGHGSGNGSSTGTRQGGLELFARGTLTATNGYGAGNAFVFHQTASGGGLGGSGNYLGGNGFQLVGHDEVTIADTALGFLDSMIEGNIGAGPIFVVLDNDLDLILDGPGAFVNDSFNRTVAIGGDLNLLSSIQNFGTGDLTFLAGYNGAGDINGTSTFQPLTSSLSITGILDVDFASPTPVFGSNDGTLTIGHSSQTTRTTIGTRLGTHQFAGHRLALVGGNAADASSQIGFRDQLGTYFSGITDLSSGLTETISAIHLYIRSGGLSLAGGAADRAYTQIGHGGYGADDSAQNSPANNVIAITFVDPGDIELLAGVGAQSYAQVGHGALGTNAVRDRRGDLSLTGFDDLLLRSGMGPGAFAVIGHGGADATSGLLSGDIDVHGVSGAVTLSTESGLAGAYAQIGHGGLLSGASSGLIEGDICLITGTHLSLTATSGLTGSYAQIGHGGINRQGDFSGNLVITTGIAGSGGVSLAGGTSEFSYSQIGHGGINASGLLSGEITVVADRTTPNGGDISIMGGSLASAYGMIGHGDGEGATSSGRRQGGIHLFSSANFSVTNGSGAPNTNYYHQTGSSGGLAGNYDGGDGFQVVVNGTTSIASTAEDDVDVLIEASLGSGPVYIQRADDFNVIIDDQDRFVDSTSDFYIATGGSITLLRSYQNAGTGAVILVAGWDGLGTLTPGEVSYETAPGGAFNYCRPTITAERRDFDFNDCATFGNEIAGGDDLFGMIAIGSAIQDRAVAIGSRAGRTLLRGYGLDVTGGDQSGAYSQLGYQSTGSAPITGEIDIRLKQGGLSVMGGSSGGTTAFARIGHGGLNATKNGTINAAITIDFCKPGAVALIGGENSLSFAQVGHGGNGSAGSDFRGEIILSGTSAISVKAGSATGAYAQIGHGGFSSDANLSGAIRVLAEEDISLAAVPSGDLTAYAMIGHGDDLRGGVATLASSGSRDGLVQVGAGTSLNLTSASIGHRAVEPSLITGLVELAISRNAPTSPTGGEFIVDSYSALASGQEGIKIYLPRRSNNQIAPGALLNGIAYAGASVDPSFTQGDDEFVVNALSPSGANFLAQHGNAFGTGPSPGSANRASFNYDTIELLAPIQVNTRFVNKGDQLINDDRRKDEAAYTGFDEVFFLYEGFHQYDWSGTSTFTSGLGSRP